ncbi:MULTISPECIES: universal stress protein [Delftia]|jgi:nucleotide-binding universal stress UspA family protein|uniref:universal stress protein n=1 Tax=Delftia TaxID=80865 RepID=UPI0002F2D7F5|nr:MULTISPECIES: universal stress protein [Delftia]MDC2862951.1 universal stress protein [Delftia sp. DT-2]TDF22731.1 universal stress protein [Delftia tsuruhatensis]
MKKVYAYIDGLTTTPAVIDWAAWSARRLGVPLELLHVLERDPDAAAVSDFSGAIGLGAQEELLSQLSELDAQRGRLSQQAGRQMLDRAQERARSAGVEQVAALMRQGELVDTVLEMEPDARLVVLGEHHRPGKTGMLHLDHHVERVVRAAKCPVLVATKEDFAEPAHFAIADDGSTTAIKMVAAVARSPMLAGLPCSVVRCGTDDGEARRSLDEAQQVLQAAGFEVNVAMLRGDAHEAIPDWLASQGTSLLVMGAYGHSRIRHLVVGSTTTTLLRVSPCPVLILR